MGHKKQRLLRYIIYPFIYIVVGLIVFLVVGVPAINALKNDFVFMASSGESVNHFVLNDEDIQIEPSETNDGTIEKEEWQEPQFGEKYGNITCDAIELKAPLYCGDTDEILEKGAGTSLASSFPGKGEKILIGAHDTTFFAPLADAKVGDEIKVNCTYGNYVYKISSIDIIMGADYDLSNEDEEEMLILYTCYPFGQTGGARNEKIIYTCDLVSGPTINWRQK